MSTGAFENAIYENLAGNVKYPCRVQPETLALDIGGAQNDSATGPATTGVARIALRRGKRSFGPTIRTVTIKLTASGSGATADYKEGNIYVIPTMTNAFHDGIAGNETGTYQGVACEVVSKFPE